MPDALGGSPHDDSRDGGGWLHGLSHAETAQRARLEDLLDSPDQLTMLAVQHNEPVNQIRALLERQLYNLPPPAPRITTVQPPRDRTPSRDGGGGRDKEIKGRTFGASMPPPRPRKRRKRWGWVESDRSDSDEPDDDEEEDEEEDEDEDEEEKDDDEGDGAGDGDVLMVDDGPERSGAVVGVKRVAESEPDDDEGDG